MKAIIEAGGVGTRFWPLSRTQSPKQFKPMVEGKSTLEMVYNHVSGHISTDNIYVGTNQKYLDLIKPILPQLSDNQFFPEPANRDLGPAVGYAMSILNLQNPDEPTAILWSDDLIKKPEVFHKVLSVAEEHLKNNPKQIVYIGQKPLFADQNKGWIHKGEDIEHFNGISMSKFLDFHYRPPLETAKQYFQGDQHAVNTGYFVSTPRFIMELYEKFAPQMYQQLTELANTWGTPAHYDLLEKIYPELEKISFDDLILAKTAPEQAVVIVSDLGWYGFGDWEAVKAAQQENPTDTVTQGNVVSRNSKNSIIYNFTDKLVTGIDLQDMIVVATDDVIMVCPQSSIPEIKKMLKDFTGTENEKYT